MKNLLSAAGAIKKAKEMSAKEFEAAFESQIEVLDQDNMFNANEENFNIIFHGKDNASASISFFNGKLESAYIE